MKSFNSQVNVICWMYLHKNKILGIYLPSGRYFSSLGSSSSWREIYVIFNRLMLYSSISSLSSSSLLLSQCSLMSVARVHMFVIPGKHLTWLTKGTHSRKINLPPHSPSRSLYWALQYLQTWKMLALRLWMCKTEYSSHYCTKSIFYFSLFLSEVKGL